MGDAPAHSNRREQDALIHSYIQKWEQRLPQFKRDHELELRETGSDALGRFLHGHLLFRGKSAYDSLLQSMLTLEERDRLHTDPKLTQAWQIFVDLCWVRKRMKQGAIVLAIVLLCFAALILIVWATPSLIGPKSH